MVHIKKKKKQTLKRKAKEKLQVYRGFPGGLVVKNPPAMQETRVWSLGQEEEMATHSSVLAWRIPGMGEPGGLPSMGSHRVRHD